MHGQLWMTLLGMFPFSLFNFLPNQEAFLGTGNNGPVTSSFNTLPHQLHKWVQTIQKLWPIAIFFSCHCSLIDVFNSHIRTALNINKNFHHTVLFKLYKSISFNALIKITKSNLKTFKWRKVNVTSGVIVKMSSVSVWTTHLAHARIIQTRAEHEIIHVKNTENWTNRCNVAQRKTGIMHLCCFSDD